MSERPTPPGEPLVVYSSWRGIFAAGASLILLAGLSVWAASRNPSSWITAFLGVVTLGTAAVVAFDYPAGAEFTTQGIRRRCLLRRPLLGWPRIDAITRTSPHRTMAGRARLRPGGLVAAVGRRRYLLTNGCESEDEFGSLRAVLRELDLAHLLVAEPPPEGHPPTWLYRRKRPAS